MLVSGRAFKKPCASAKRPEVRRVRTVRVLGILAATLIVWAAKFLESNSHLAKTAVVVWNAHNGNNVYYFQSRKGIGGTIGFARFWSTQKYIYIYICLFVPQLVTLYVHIRKFCQMLTWSLRTDRRSEVGEVRRVLEWSHWTPTQKRWVCLMWVGCVCPSCFSGIRMSHVGVLQCLVWGES